MKKFIWLLIIVHTTLLNFEDNNNNHHKHSMILEKDEIEEILTTHKKYIYFNAKTHSLINDFFYIKHHISSDFSSYYLNTVCDRIAQGKRTAPVNVVIAACYESAEYLSSKDIVLPAARRAHLFNNIMNYYNKFKSRDSDCIIVAHRNNRFINNDDINTTLLSEDGSKGLIDPEQSLKFNSPIIDSGRVNVYEFGIRNFFAGSGAINTGITGTDNISIGSNANNSLTNGTNTIAIGTNTQAIGSGSVAIGNGATLSQNDAILLGNAMTKAVKVGIGIATPQAKLDIIGASPDPVLRLDQVTTHTTNAPVWLNPSVSAASGIPIHYTAAHQLFGFTSSKRYTINIRPLDRESEIIYQLTPVMYDTKGGYGIGKNIPGFVAEDVYTIAPHLVVLNQEGQPEAVAYNALHALTIKELQKHQQQLSAQQQQCNAQTILLQKQGSIIDILLQNVKISLPKEK